MSINTVLHPDFRLNGFRYSQEELKEVAYSLVKEGEAHEREIGDFLLDWLSNRPTIGVQTSGSTGKPSVHRFNKQRMVHSAGATAKFFGFQPAQKALLCLPARYIGGKMMLVRAMVSGLSLHYVEPASSPLEATDEEYDFCAMVPMQFMGSLGAMHRICTLIIGGAPVGIDAIAAAQNLNTSVFETFGMTETISHIALRRINPPGELFTTLDGIRVATDSRGCLIIDAPAILKSPVYTNDLVRVVSDTEFEWLGRIDHVVNSGGIKLVPEQIEKKIQHIMNNRFFLTGLPDKKLGQQLVLVWEGGTPPENLLESIRKSGTLEPYEIPRKILASPGFSTTDNGKIRRAATLEDMVYPYG